jgi:hypothetical protein
VKILTTMHTLRTEMMIAGTSRNNTKIHHCYHINIISFLCLGGFNFYRMNLMKVNLTQPSCMNMAHYKINNTAPGIGRCTYCMTHGSTPHTICPVWPTAGPTLCKRMEFTKAKHSGTIQDAQREVSRLWWYFVVRCCRGLKTA